MSAVTTLLKRNVIFYDGPSLLDGSRILGIATAKTSNPKTGPMVQTWILKAEVDPWSIVKANDDASICGNCRHRGVDGKDRSCYVNVWRAPLGVWKARENTDRLDPTAFGELLKARSASVRLGAYGDPAAIPTPVWSEIVKNATIWTGYTHQWRTCDPNLARYCMASVDSMDEYLEATRNGWRTFRVRTPEGPLDSQEVICPASDEAGNRVTCAQCKLCQGTAKQAKSVAIIVHGATKGAFLHASH